ncbi:MAG: glycosyltransferase family 4 protein [Flavipsychrobacter sp.]
MNILLATEVIHPGGAETFILRLATSLQKAGHNVHLFIFYKDGFNDKLYNLLAPNVPITKAHIPNSFLLRKIDGVLFRLKIDYSFRIQYIKKALRKVIATHKTEVIHSHLLKTDSVCLDVASEQNIPVVNTIHGDYLQFYNKTKNNVPIPLLNYQKKATHNLKRLNRVVCISDKQLAFFKEHFAEETNNKLSKIYNGYTGQVKRQPKELRNKLHIPDGDFVFGMVSRGILEKGWQVAIDAFIKIKTDNTHLVLVGASDYLTELQEQYASEKNIHFTGHADNPLDWVNMMDVGLLPTTYPSESLPTVVIEYLCCGKPVVASNAGEINNMIKCGEAVAGLIIPIENNTVSANDVGRAMNTYLNDKPLLEKHIANTSICYEQFDMKKCIDAYLKEYKHF